MNFTQKKNKIKRDIELKEVQTEHGIKYLEFDNTPNTIQLRDEDKGKRIWHCAYPRTKKMYLKDITDEGFLIIQIHREVPSKTCFRNECVLHPSEWTKERLNESK